jgi:excisionase family DNA binding protein
MSTTLLTDSEAAEILRLTPRQVARLARRGELPSVQLPGNEVRFDPDDIRRWVETRKRPLPQGGAQ